MAHVKVSDHVAVRPVVGHQTRVVIEPPNFQRATITIIGTTPYVQHRFPAKTRIEMEERHRAGQQARKGRVRKARDFEEEYKQAAHRSREGWIGISAGAFRNAMISACRVVNFKMTLAKLSLFVEADGFDKQDGTPLVRLYGAPRVHQGLVRNATGVADIRWRPMWEEWTAKVRCMWDGDQFSAQDVVNLMARVGMQVGVGEGRHDSKDSNGIGWGCFKVKS